jgi:hypothetical protein
MTGKQRLGLLAIAVIVAVAAFVIVKPGDDEDDSAGNGGTPAGQTTPAGGSTTPTATAPSAPEPPQPVVHRITIRGSAPAGGVKQIEATRGDTVTIVVDSDVDDEIHLHGYDVFRDAAPGSPARFRFRADIEGIFEIESHVAEDAGKDPLIAKLTVRPS